MNNPYSAPRAVLSEPVSSDVYEPSMFSVRGRIGRWRYLAYSFTSMFLLSLALGIPAAILIPIISRMANSKVGIGIMIVLMYIPFIAATFIMAKRRLHDLNRSGWWSLLLIIPLLNLLFALYLMFGPGTAGSNQYGPKPAPNAVWLIIVGLLLPIFFVGTLAAIALPAYQDYVLRAKAKAVSTQSED